MAIQALLIFCTSLFLWAGQAFGATVEGVRLWTAPDHTRLVFDVDVPVKHSIFQLPKPARLVVDFENSEAGPAYNAKGLKDRHIGQLRHAHREDGRFRVVLDLNNNVTPKSFLLPPNGDYGNRLVVDLYGTDTGSTKPKAVSEPRVAKSEAQLTQLRDVVIAVDAGHGGEDPGASGAQKRTKEKTVTLQIAERLKRQIDAQPGMRAVLTRTGDYYVGLRKRMDLARAQRADLFISIHADAFHDKRVRGSSVYILSNRGASSEAAKWLAQRENRSDLVGGLGLDSMEPNLARLILDLSQSATLEASMSAANQVYKNLGQLGKVHGKKVQQANFMVLKSPDIPSMLVETGFISNPTDERNLRSGDYQEKLARTIMQGVRRYFREVPPPGTLLAKQTQDERARQHTIVKGDTLSQIAARYDVSLNSLRNVNRIKNDRRIYVGQVLRIPGT